MDGGGSINLGTETLDLRVRPQARVAGTSLVVPMRVTGPFRSPAAAPDPAAAVAANAGTVAGAVLGNATPLGLMAGALGGHGGGNAEAADCGAALALVRGSAGGPAAAQPAAGNRPRQPPRHRHRSSRSRRIRRAC